MSLNQRKAGVTDVGCVQQVAIDGCVPSAKNSPFQKCFNSHTADLRNTPLPSVNRQGATIFAVLFFMFFATAIIIGTLSFSLRQQRQLARQIQAQQTAWLLDAGLAKALDQLAFDPNYRGESIVIEPAINQYVKAEVVIVVKEKAETEPYTIGVTAILVAAEGSETTVRRSIEVKARNSSLPAFPLES